MDVFTGASVGELILYKDLLEQGETHGGHVLDGLKSEEDRVMALQDYFSICLTEEKKGY